jgi:hypothetical protein
MCDCRACSAGHWMECEYDLEALRNLCRCRAGYKCLKHRLLESATEAVPDDNNRSCMRGSDDQVLHSL